MMKMYSMGGAMPGMDGFGRDETLTLNVNNALVKYIFENPDSENGGIFCKQLYDLARLSNAPLSPEEMAEFVKRSNEVMMLLTK